MLCLFTAPETWKVAFIGNMMFVRKLGSHSELYYKESTWGNQHHGQYQKIQTTVERQLDEPGQDFLRQKITINPRGGEMWEKQSRGG
jgi:hypothetical protein